MLYYNYYDPYTMANLFKWKDISNLECIVIVSMKYENLTIILKIIHIYFKYDFQDYLDTEIPCSLFDIFYYIRRTPVSSN